ncbi:DUF4178 domain-containing protein [Alkalihalobacillus sp. AL-G]|uniref:DUF4178 domain-containing protein n=1 Tax=Alkalihalobacillus sp. AL-G TaxID=2926399 RepID=UPI0027299CC7|nr:DUF4178 domain-containing protein [Alkalihalobacillus sp. AL-G]WLD94765.1 DUF4178 domain-containing protein [Alkalihalobacillus sp. AL-G]
MSLFSRIFKKKEKEIEEVKERNFFNIRIDDIVTYDLEDYQVSGKLIYKDGGYEWLAYQLVGATETIWLSVEMDDELELAIYKSSKEKLTQPIPNKVTINKTEYILEEKGTATVQGEGRGKNVHGQEVKYFDFVNQSEDQFLSVEVWGSEVEVSEGHEIEGYEIKVIAAS